MEYYDFAMFHFVTIFPAFMLGTLLLFKQKGTIAHRVVGYVYVALVSISCMVSLLMPASVGPSVAEHFGFLHLLSVWVLFAFFQAIRSVKQGDISSHASWMKGVYVGGLIVAGAFTLLPGRMLHHWVFA